MNSSAGDLKVAYIMSRFPKLTETFVLYEMLAVEAEGVPVEIYPLMREKTNVMHSEAVPLVKRAHFTPIMSPGIVASNLRYLFRKPGTYLGTLWTSLRATWGSRRFFAGILAFFPKAVHMAHLMSKDNIGHIHAHFASHPAAVAFIIHQMTGIPYSFTAHGSDLHRDQHMLCEKISSAKFAAAISNYNKEMMAELCGKADRIMIVHCGVNTQAFQPKTPQNEQLNVLCIGTLHEVKGQTHLIEACRLLKERDIDFVCHLVGSGGDLEMLQKQTAEAGLTDKVRFHGRLPQNEVIAMLKAVDVVAAPSVPSADGRREGIPVALMEAMATGKPVVASRLSGIPELVEDGQSGFLIEPGDAQGIADALATLSSDAALREKMGQAGREKVLNEFDLSKNAVTLAQLFKGKTS